MSTQDERKKSHARFVSTMSLSSRNLFVSSVDISSRHAQLANSFDVPVNASEMKWCHTVLHYSNNKPARECPHRINAIGRMRGLSAPCPKPAVTCLISSIDISSRHAQLANGFPVPAQASNMEWCRTVLQYPTGKPVHKCPHKMDARGLMRSFSARCP